MTEGVTPAGGPSTASLSARIVIFAVTTAIASLSWPLVVARAFLTLAVNRPFAVTESLHAARFFVPMIAMSAAILGVSRKRRDVWWWVCVGCGTGVLIGVLLLATAEYFRKGESPRVFFGVLVGAIPWVALPGAVVGGVLGATIGALFRAATKVGVSQARFLGLVGLSTVGHVITAVVSSRFLGAQWP
jgi:hypothetical protein